MYYDFSLEMCRENIRGTKRVIRIQYGLLIFNIAAAVMNGTLVYYGTGHISNAITLGAMIINCLWTLVYIFEYRKDMYFDKERLAFLEKQRDDKNLQESIKQMESSKTFYETAYANLLRLHIQKNPEGSGQSDSGIQSEKPIPNCS